jgi:hypothetical protein
MGNRLRARQWLLVCIVALALPHISEAAELLFTPASGTFPNAAEFSIKVTINPKGQSVNAADGTIAFDPSALSVVSISKEGSAFSLWTAEPSFSNSAGTITFSGGTPTAFTASGQVLSITFKPKKVGSASLSFTKGTVLAADGKGTDVYEKGGTATLTIDEAAAGESGDAEGSDVGGGEDITPIAPIINSSTHPKVDAWYSTTSVEFSWKPTVDVIGVRTLFSEAETAAPNTLQDQKTATSQRLVAANDGVWFFHVQYRNDFGWGEQGKRKIQIDSVPPEAFELRLVDGDPPKFAFSTEDELSGVDRYEILFGEDTAATVKAGDLVDGMTPVPPQDGGMKKVRVKAIDKAGNVRIAEKEMELPKVVKPTKGGEPVVEDKPLWTIERVLTILFALAIGGLATSGYYAKKRVQEDKVRLLQGVLEVREKNDKVFSAMREEFEQMVNDFDEKPQLTAAERDFLEKIKEVLDISEELVDTGIEDLKRKVRGQ